MGEWPPTGKLFVDRELRFTTLLDCPSVCMLSVSMHGVLEPEGRRLQELQLAYSCLEKCHTAELQATCRWLPTGEMSKIWLLLLMLEDIPCLKHGFASTNIFK